MSAADTLLPELRCLSDRIIAASKESEELLEQVHALELRLEVAEAEAEARIAALAKENEELRRHLSPPLPGPGCLGGVR